MKLRDIAKRDEKIVIGDGENKMEVLLTSLTSTDVAERQEHYDKSLKDALAYATGRAEAAREVVNKMPFEQKVQYLLAQELMYLAWERDKLNIENSESMSADELERARDAEIEKIKEKKKKELEAKPDGELAERTFIYVYRTIYIEKFDELMSWPSLVLTVKDPKDESRLLSMDPESEDYVGHLSKEVLDELLAKSAQFRYMIDASGVRKMAEDPSFLLFTPPVMNGV